MALPPGLRCGQGDVPLARYDRDDEQDGDPDQV